MLFAESQVITRGNGQCVTCAKHLVTVLIDNVIGGRQWWPVEWDLRTQKWRVHEHEPQPTKKAA